MKSFFQTTFSVCLLVLLLAEARVFGEAEQMLPVASCESTPGVTSPVETRVYKLLMERKIESVAAGTIGLTVCVPESRLEEARQILAKAIQQEGLKIVLHDSKGK